jgi:hypothetical protein
MTSKIGRREEYAAVKPVTFLMVSHVACHVRFTLLAAAHVALTAKVSQWLLLPQGLHGQLQVWATEHPKMFSGAISASTAVESSLQIRPRQCVEPQGSSQMHLRFGLARRQQGQLSLTALIGCTVTRSPGGSLRHAIIVGPYLLFRVGGTLPVADWAGLSPSLTVRH